MPDGFDPMTELERINTLRVIIAESRKYSMEGLHVARNIMRDIACSPLERLAAVKIIHDRAYGRPTQQIQVNVEQGNESLKEQRVQIYLPDNGRPNIIGRVIDIDQAA